MDPRAERIGRNEDLFREVNERLEGLNETFAVVTETFTVVCECGNAECVEQLTIATPEYERVRSDPALFLIVPGHQIPDVEDVVEHGDGYEIVRKHEGDPENLAAALDPRQ